MEDDDSGDGGDAPGTANDSESAGTESAFTDDAYTAEQCPPEVTVNRVVYGSSDVDPSELTAEIAVHGHDPECTPSATVTIAAGNRTVIERDLELDESGRYSIEGSVGELDPNDSDATVRVELSNGTVLANEGLPIRRGNGTES